MRNQIIHRFLLTIFLLVTRNHTMQQDLQNSNSIANAHQYDIETDKFEICGKVRVYGKGRSFKQLSLTIKEENNKIYRAISLEHFINKPGIRKFIIDELKKDNKCISQLINKSVFFVLPGTDTLFKYRIGNRNFCLHNNKKSLFLRFEVLLNHTEVKEFIYNFYKIKQKHTHKQNESDQSLNIEQSKPIQQTFMHKYPKTSLLLATSYGVIGTSALLKLATSQYFLNASFLGKITQLSLASIGYIWLGSGLIKELTKI